MSPDPRPAQHFARFHQRSRARDPDYVYSLARIVLTPILWLPFRTRAIGTENVPAAGPAILAPNHFSLADHFFLALFLRRKVRFMAKSELFRWPLDFILSHGGSFPVRRRGADDEAIATARSILDRDQVLGIYAEGGRSRTGRLGEPRRGLGRIALESGAPVVPVAIHGTSEVKRMQRLHVPKVTVQYGEPLAFGRSATTSRDAALEVSQLVFGKVREMYEALEALGRRGVLRAYRAAGAPA